MLLLLNKNVFKLSWTTVLNEYDDDYDDDDDDDAWFIATVINVSRTYAVMVLSCFS